MAGFGLIKMTKVSEDEYRFVNAVDFPDSKLIFSDI